MTHWLDPMLPKMRCDKGCGECCGVVACDGSEYERVRQYAQRHGIVPARQGTQCPWYQNGGCAVYEARPFVCRMFGHTTKMECPRGYNVNVPLTVERYAITRFKSQYGRNPSLKLLHEFVYTPEQFQAIIQAEMDALPASASVRTPSPEGMTEQDARDRNRLYHAAKAMAIAGKGFQRMSFQGEDDGTLVQFGKSSPSTGAIAFKAGLSPERINP